MKTYRIYDPEIDAIVETNNPDFVMDYLTDTFVTDSPLTIETLENGKVIDRTTYDPKEIGQPPKVYQ